MHIYIQLTFRRTNSRTIGNKRKLVDDTLVFLSRTYIIESIKYFDFEDRTLQLSIEGKKIGPYTLRSLCAIAVLAS